MTIRKGQDWGTEVDRPADLVVTDSDAALATALVAHPTDSRPVTVTSGDLFRTLGARAVDPTMRRMRRLTLDLLDVRIDGVQHVAVAHVVARRRWWRGRVVAVCNAQFHGTWDVAPRSHPNDGRAEVIEVDPAMTVRERWQAWRRLPTGTHLPHPRLRSTRTAGSTWHFDPALDVYVDGRRHRRVRELAVTVRPDGFELHL